MAKELKMRNGYLLRVSEKNYTIQEPREACRIIERHF